MLTFCGLKLVCLQCLRLWPCHAVASDPPIADAPPSDSGSFASLTFGGLPPQSAAVNRPSSIPNQPSPIANRQSEIANPVLGGAALALIAGATAAALEARRRRKRRRKPPVAMRPNKRAKCKTTSTAKPCWMPRSKTLA